MKVRGIVCVRSIAPPDASMSGFHSGREEHGELSTSAAETRNIRAGLQFLDEPQVAAVCTRLACEQAQIVQTENTILASEYVSLALTKKQRERHFGAHVLNSGEDRGAIGDAFARREEVRALRILSKEEPFRVEGGS
jgi:hypothetical protein